MSEKEKYLKFVDIVINACEKEGINPPQAHKFLFIFMRAIEKDTKTNGGKSVFMKGKDE